MATKTSFNMPRLDKLEPYGATRDTVSDVSQEICRKKGKKVRSEAHDDLDAPHVVSPFSQPIDHPLNLALITITPAGKTAADADDAGEGDTTAQVIPIPEPRPVN
jgi:D-alanyl-D-alanine carboxypeptidase